MMNIKTHSGDLVHLKGGIYARVENKQNGDERVTVFELDVDYSPCGQSSVMGGTLSYRKVGQVELLSDEKI